MPTVPGGALVLAAPHARFDDRYQFETAVWTYAVSNPGTVPIRITERIALDGTGRLTVQPETLAPGASGRIEVAQPLADRLGEVAFRYAILTDEPGTPRYRFTLSGFVQSAYDPERPRLDFGVLDRARGGRAEAEVASREVERLEVLAAEDAPAYLQVSWSAPAVAGGPLRIAATLAPGAPLGLLTGAVSLRTNLPHQPLVGVRYVAQVFGDVVPQENPLRLGAIRIGESGSRIVRLQSRSGRPFTVESAADAAGPSGPLAVSVRTCDGTAPPSSCQELALRLTPLLVGPVAGRVEVRIAGESESLPLIYNALAIRPDAVIHQLEVPAPVAPTPSPERRP